MAIEATIGDGGHRWGPQQPLSAEVLGEITLAPTFDDSIESVRVQIEAVIGRSTVITQHLEEAHPAVRNC